MKKYKTGLWELISTKPASWFDPNWMFGVSDGFNIVIANPPYIFARNSQKKDLHKN